MYVVGSNSRISSDTHFSTSLLDGPNVRVRDTFPEALQTFRECPEVNLIFIQSLTLPLQGRGVALPEQIGVEAMVGDSPGTWSSRTADLSKFAFSSTDNVEPQIVTGSRHMESICGQISSTGSLGSDVCAQLISSRTLGLHIDQLGQGGHESVGVTICFNDNGIVYVLEESTFMNDVRAEANHFEDEVRRLLSSASEFDSPEEIAARYVQMREGFDQRLEQLVPQSARRVAPCGACVAFRTASASGAIHGSSPPSISNRSIAYFRGVIV